jgi:hypothetical protein
MSKWVLWPAAVLAALAGVSFLHFVLVKRELIASTPSPRPLFEVTDLKLPPQQQLCIRDVTIPHDAKRLRVQVRTFGRPGPALDVALRAPGYGERLTVPAGYPDLQVTSAPMTPPRTDSLGEVCLRHGGANEIALAASAEDRTRSRPEGVLDGRPERADAYLAFYEAGRSSALSRMGPIVSHMGAFRPGIVGPWLLWPLLVLVVVGVPGGVLWAIHRAVSAAS